ncbi:NAD-dependent histone deacetylase sir2 [Linnemannia hyalina]|uniref:NAD-dependent histone deacetylase sir2 n=1 Tax=Linnemannia hyalina TaxID=64524 RepID=A0A9P8BUK5_9FUNG|nr:NAD-dependent histone deacetylase sir2 [Linnemannia hyalina]
MSSQQPDPAQGPSRPQHPQVTATAEDTANINSINLKVPHDLLTNRPESPVNRKRTDDHSATGQDSHHLDDGSPNSHSLPPTKKSKTSPPLAPRLDNNYRTSRDTIEDVISPQTSPLLEPSLPFATPSTSEKRYSPATNAPTQIKARKLDDDRPLSPAFRPTSPSFGASSPPFRATSPSFTKSATAILDSLSKPGENSLGNLNLGTPTLNKASVAERAMGVITSRPGSRQTSPDPLAVKAAAVATELEPGITHSGATAPADTCTGSNTSPLEAMVTSSDDDEHHHLSSSLGIEAQLSGVGDDFDDEEGILSGDLASQEPFVYSSGSEDEYGSESMGEIDVENIAMGDSDFELEHEGSPYIDVDPLCEDRMTAEEAEELLHDARMRGMEFVIRKYVVSGMYTAKKLLLLTIPDALEIPDHFTEQDLLVAASDRIRRVLRKRKRLDYVHSLQHVVELLKNSKRIMVLTGAGVSVSCGIPDFRSKDGIYSRLSEFELDDPQQMFDLDFFRERPEIFYSFAREIFPSNFTPSPSHYFIKLLEDHGKLLRNYTQNIDTLEQKAGIRSVLQCHGSFATASCVRCRNQVQGDEIKDSIFKQEVAYCKVCKKPTPPPKARKRSKAKFDFDDDDDDSEEEDDDNRALMKPDIVFFGEKLPQIFDRSLADDRELVDLLIVIGSSLKVAPVSDIMHQLPNKVPQILINRTPNHQMDFDVQLLGNCDAIVAELCRMVGWELKHDKLPGGTSNVPDMDNNTNMDGSGTGGRAAWTFKEPNLYLFEGADLEELDFEAIKEKNRKRLMEMSGVYKGALGGLGDNDQEEDDEEDEEDEDEEDDEEDEDDGDGDGDDDDDETGPVSEDMEGLLTVSSERRPQSREGRATSVVMMDEDGDDSDNASGESEDTIRAAVVHTFGVNPATTSTATTLGAGAVPTLNEGFLSPRLQPSVGFASGTTEPRSGSITEIHQDILSAAAEAAAAIASAPPTSAAGPGASTERVRTLFTEHMPKDLGEDETVFDTSSTSSSYSHGNVFLSHSRRPSEDLVPITEDPQLEVDDDEEVDVDVDIEIGGPELARGAGGGGRLI